MQKDGEEEKSQGKDGWRIYMKENSVMTDTK